MKKNEKVVDVCLSCKVPDDPVYSNSESIYFFSCSDCACFMCVHRHACSGQCSGLEAK